MAARLRAVVVGCGGISNAWMNSRAVKEGAEVVGVVDLCEETTRRFVEKWKLPASTFSGTELAAVLKAAEPDVVFDLTIPEAHCEVTCTALQHGCHVIGEKPMAATLEEGRRMVGEAKAAGKIYAVTQTRRYNPRIRQLQAFLESGAIGQVHTVHADFFIAAHFGGFREKMDHVLLLDMAIHSFDQARMLTPGLPARVVAESWNPPGSWYRDGASAWAAFMTATGARFHYRGSWTATGAQTTWECGWRILGDRGAVSWNGGDEMHAERVVDPDQPSAEHGGGLMRNLEEIEIPNPIADGYRSEHDGAIYDALSAIRKGRAPETVCHDNFYSLAMVHAAIESSEKGCIPVEIG